MFKVPPDCEPIQMIKRNCKGTKSFYACKMSVWLESEITAREQALSPWKGEQEA